MNNFKQIIIIYTLFMLAALVVIYRLFDGMELVAKSVASYSGKDLEVYKQIWNNTNESFNEDKHKMFIYVLIFWGVVFFFGYVLFLLIYFLQVKPAKEIEGFASEIARGNLDINLPMHKHNMFGSFTESFDLMREELKASKEREMQAEKTKREMMAELSHDLKTPVATIQATCEVLELKIQKELEKAKQDCVTKEEQSRINELTDRLEKIGYISNKTKTINQLVDNVFRANLDDMKGISAEPEEEDSRLIEGYFGSLKDYGNIILDNHISECLVLINRLRMEQVIDNIVGNSYKYAGTDIHVAFDEVKIPDNSGKEKSFIKIIIRDEGPGVNEEELPLIVEKYYRGKDKKEKQGYGLGLYLVKHYMEKQGGGMEYYNDNGFVVELLVRKV